MDVLLIVLIILGALLVFGIIVVVVAYSRLKRQRRRNNAPAQKQSQRSQPYLPQQQQQQQIQGGNFIPVAVQQNVRQSQEIRSNPQQMQQQQLQRPSIPQVPQFMQSKSMSTHSVMNGPTVILSAQLVKPQPPVMQGQSLPNNMQQPATQYGFGQLVQSINQQQYQVQSPNGIQQPASRDDATNSRVTNAHSVDSTTLITQGKTLAMPGFLSMVEGTDFSVNERFAEGAGGTLYLGELLTRYGIDRAEGETQCVVKQIKPEAFESQQDCQLSFQQEVSIMWLVYKSKHVAKIRGFCMNPLSILMKYYRFGTLYDLIHQRNNHVPDDKWSPRFVMSLAQDIAEGLGNLHDEGVVHSDIKPANIFIDKDEQGQLRAIIGDLGVASIIDSSLLRVKAYKESRIKGASLPYAAPEVIKTFVQNTPEDEANLASPAVAKAGDVFSFGVVAFECLTRKFAWHGVQEDIAMLVLDNKRPRFPQTIQLRRQSDYLVDVLCQVITRSWSQNHACRPTFADILTTFQQCLAALPSIKQQVNQAAVSSQQNVYLNNNASNGQLYSQSGVDESTVVRTNGVQQQF
ncbi:hypothetical protein MP228_010559 [Amoeboaphelidium protococcarum]|nr:hypothetical protein MP228_010559 [Amoeboaphelidium protococcarum]